MKRVKKSHPRKLRKIFQAVRREYEKSGLENGVKSKVSRFIKNSVEGQRNRTLHSVSKENMGEKSRNKWEKIRSYFSKRKKSNKLKSISTQKYTAVTCDWVNHFRWKMWRNSYPLIEHFISESTTSIFFFQYGQSISKKSSGHVHPKIISVKTWLKYEWRFCHISSEIRK